MRIRIKSLVVGAAALVITTGALVAGGSPAFAAVTPGWEPDNNALGSITFYNSAGTEITGGSLQDPSSFYSVASGPGRTGDDRAQLRAGTPQVGVDPANWTGDTLSATTPYPPAGAPANIANIGRPVVSGAVTDLSVAQYIDAIPNVTTAVGYKNLYELRLFTSGPGQGPGNKYYRSVIEVTITGTSNGLVTGTWAVIYPVPATPTNTTLVASPANSAPSGSTVTLTATVTPHVAGSVRFFDGATDLGLGSYNASTGVATKALTPGDGAHSYRADFTPAQQTDAPSSSAALSYTVVPAGAVTSTTLSANPTSPASGDASNNVTATLTANVTPVGTAGTVEFFDGATSLGGADTYVAGTGIATKAVTFNTTGSPHFLTARFTPASGDFQPSTSAVLSFVVLPANYGTAGIPISAQNNTPPYAGNLTLQVAAGTAINLSQVDPNSADGHPVQATDSTGHRRAWVFTGGLSGVAVSDTRPSAPGWTVSGQASDFSGGISAKNLGWFPSLVSAGSDAEGAVTAGSVISSILKNALSNGLASPGGNLASAASGNGLGTQNLAASLELRIPDTSPTGTYASTLTLTLVSP